jgi:translation initiation factor 2 alpha subunit (eIF-2alpha)
MEKGLEPKKACIKAKKLGKRQVHIKHYYMGKPLYEILGGSWTKAYCDVMNAYNRGYKIEEAVKKFGVKQ